MTRLRWRTSAAALGCSLVGAGPAAAADAELEEICSGERQPFVSPAFERIDLDGNERLTPEEAAECAALAAVFSRLDLDADGALTRTEYRGFADTWRRRLRTFGDDAR
jgi:hypothetical protein